MMGGKKGMCKCSVVRLCILMLYLYLFSTSGLSFVHRNFDLFIVADENNVLV